MLVLYNLYQSIHHVHDNEPSFIDNNGERLHQSHQTNKVNTNNATCDVHVSMFNDTRVSIQPMTRIDKIGEQSTNDNAPSNIFISLDQKKTHTEWDFYIIIESERYSPSRPKSCSGKEKEEYTTFAETNIPEEARLPLLKQLLIEDKPILTLTSISSIPQPTNKLPTYILWVESN